MREVKAHHSAMAWLRSQNPKDAAALSVCVQCTLKDGGSPAARLRFAHLTLAHLGSNDGAKLWVSFKLCFKTNDFGQTRAVVISFNQINRDF